MRWTHERKQNARRETGNAVTVIADAIANSIWSTPSAKQQPYVQTLRWTVRQLPNGDRHVCASLGHEGRISIKLKQ